MSKFKGLIFDFNGVLLFDQYLHDDVFKKIAIEIRGRPFTEEESSHSVQGRNNKLIFEYLFGRVLSSREVEEWATKKELEYHELSRKEGEKYTLSPGATALLDELKERGIPFTIATSSPAMNVRFFNEMLHLEKWFDMDKVVYDGGTLAGKPAPDIYLLASEKLSLKPKECVVIEDARSGIESAFRAHVGHIIAIGPKSTHEILRNLEGVNEVIETLTEVDVNRLF